MRKPRALVATASVVLAACLSVMTGASASASTASPRSTTNGVLTVLTESHRSLLVTGNWGPKTPTAYVKPGTKSSRHFYDTDGFYVPRGCQVDVMSYSRKYGGYYNTKSFGSQGWVKTNNLQDWALRVVC